MKEAPFSECGHARQVTTPQTSLQLRQEMKPVPSVKQLISVREVIVQRYHVNQVISVLYKPQEPRSIRARLELINHYMVLLIHLAANSVR